MHARAPIAASLALAAALALIAAQAAAKTYAQELSDRTVAANPGVIAAAIEVKAGAQGALPAPSAPVTGTRDRYEVALPMHDVAGEDVGTLRLAFARADRTGDAALERRAAGIRDALARRVLNAGNLMDPYPFEAGAETRTRAQKLVDEMQASHPDLIVLALRAPPHGSRDMVVLGSTFGRHGKKADADDLKVLESPEPRTGLYAGGKRFGADLQLRDRGGTAIGTLNVGYAYRAGDDEKALLRKAQSLRDELAPRIASADALGELDP